MSSGGSLPTAATPPPPPPRTTDTRTPVDGDEARTPIVLRRRPIAAHLHPRRHRVPPSLCRTPITHHWREDRLLTPEAEGDRERVTRSNVTPLSTAELFGGRFSSSDGSPFSRDRGNRKTRKRVVAEIRNGSSYTTGGAALYIQLSRRYFTHNSLATIKQKWIVIS